MQAALGPGVHMAEEIIRGFCNTGGSFTESSGKEKELGNSSSPLLSNLTSPL